MIYVLMDTWIVKPCVFRVGEGYFAVVNDTAERERKKKRENRRKGGKRKKKKKKKVRK